MPDALPREPQFGLRGTTALLLRQGCETAERLFGYMPCAGRPDRQPTGFEPLIGGDYSIMGGCHFAAGA